MKTLVKCVICDGKLSCWSQEGEAIQPIGGLSFISYGSYGSTVFDPMDGTMITICVCDKCLMKDIDEKKVYHSTVRTTHKVKTEILRRGE